MRRPHNNPRLVIDKKRKTGDELFFVALAGTVVVGTIMAGYAMNRTFKKFARFTLWPIVTLIVCCAALFYAMVQPGGSGVLASLRLPDGSEYMITQRCNWSAEPYTVAFYMRSANGPWGWCYIDHQANRWRNVAMTYEPESDIVTVTERGTWQAALDRKRGTFAIGDGKPRREVDAPQTTASQQAFAFR